MQQGISSKSAGKVENKAKYNGIEQNNDFDINMYDAQYRNLDPQIGRFWQIDPKPNEMLSSYAAMANNPILFSDPLGDTTTIFSAADGHYIRTIYDDLPNESHFVSGKYLPSNWKKYNTDAKIADYVRKHSKAFIGANTVADAQSLESMANKEGHEVYFLGNISSTREIRLSAVSLPAEAYKGSAEINIGDFFDKVVSEKVQEAAFLIGHTHQSAISKGGLTDPKLPTLPGKSWWSNADNGSGDYAPMLRRLVTKYDGAGVGNEVYQKYEQSQTPALIVTGTGMTVYGTGTKYIAPGPYGGYGKVENMVQPVQQSYLLYKSIKK